MKIRRRTNKICRDFSCSVAHGLLLESMVVAKEIHEFRGLAIVEYKYRWEIHVNI